MAPGKVKVNYILPLFVVEGPILESSYCMFIYFPRLEMSLLCPDRSTMGPSLGVA